MSLSQRTHKRIKRKRNIAHSRTETHTFDLSPGDDDDDDDDDDDGDDDDAGHVSGAAGRAGVVGNAHTELQ